MKPIPGLKRFLLRAMLRLNGVPWPDALLDDAVRHGLVPAPTPGDLRRAKRELERDGYIQSSRDELDDLLSWTLTEKGRHKAKQLD